MYCPRSDSKCKHEHSHVQYPVAAACHVTYRAIPANATEVGAVLYDVIVDIAPYLCRVLTSMLGGEQISAIELERTWHVHVDSTSTLFCEQSPSTCTKLRLGCNTTPMIDR
jgi:hypothetical protein